VDSIGPAAAQEFSLLPAENTSGDPAAAPDLDGRRGDAARGAGGAPRNISRGSGPRLARGCDADSAATPSLDRRQGDTARRAGGTLEMSAVAVARDHQDVGRSQIMERGIGKKRSNQ